MKIQDLFERDIHRSIKGVVKADQIDDSSVRQEVDEFVVTRELSRHFNDLVEVLLSSIDSPTSGDRNGIWISGWFGSGKSHFIKVISYLLANEDLSIGSEEHRVVDYFADKFDDAMLFADLKRVVAAHFETILFNIESKADHSAGREALLRVFLKVLNEKQGYSGDHPHIAHMERHLAGKERLADFHAAFERVSGTPWRAQRDAWQFHRDEIITTLTEVLEQSTASVEKWVDGGEEHFSLTVENFAKWVKQHLDSQGPNHQIMFLADEVGQFIGGDTHLMLSLQTITEQLGTVCDGRAWVVVTSQEDLDSVLGDLKGAKQHDFSKIQGRFKTRLSLSSANVDEVIKKRLLAKNDGASAPLVAAYEGKHDILRHQLSFANAGMSFKTYTDAADFAACYPFAAYQFSLVQKVFESIRKAGATGLHLSQGERSTLDAFQGAAKGIGDEEIGALVPFYLFYPAVEGFLDTAVKRTIDQAGESHVLEPFDATVLKVLFLIRYIDELPGNVDNLVTLCVDEIDTDRLALRKQIEASLARLEHETLVARNGDLYFFLTNEERDIGREIKNTTVPSGAEERELGKLIFEDILDDVRKHTYSVTGRDFSFTRMCDDQVVGNRIEGSLEVAFVSPLGESYGEFVDDASGIMRTGADQGQVLVRLPDDVSLGDELRAYLQTESYVKTKHMGSLTDATKRILRDRTEENRGRRERILERLRKMLTESSHFAAGRMLETKRTDPKAALGEALEYVIENAYPKMGYIHYLHPNPKQEIQSLLRANDVEQAMLGLNTPEANVQALEDLREYVRLCAMQNKQIVLYDLIEKRYGGRPYGWPELEVVLLVARLAVMKEINLVVDAAPLPLEQAYDHLTTSQKQRKVVISRRESAGTDLIKRAQAIGIRLFAQSDPSSEAGLFAALQKRLAGWSANLAEYGLLAKTGRYPGLEEIERCAAVLQRFVEEADSLRFLTRFADSESDLLAAAEDMRDLEGFYTNQRHSWDELRRSVDELAQNRLQLEGDQIAGPALARMESILADPRPYGLLREVAELSYAATKANNGLVEAARAPAVAEIEGYIDLLDVELLKVDADDTLQNGVTGELVRLLSTVQQTKSIAHIAQAQQAAGDAFGRAMAVIEEAAVDVSGGDDDSAPAPTALKKHRIVEARSYWQGGFIETPDDVDAFLAELRAALDAALEANERVQIK